MSPSMVGNVIPTDPAYDCYKGLWEILIRKHQHMENQQETELFRKCPEIH